MATQKSTEFEEAVNGQTFDFYGVDNNCFKLGDTVWEAVEDEDDGYRSYLDTVQRANDNTFVWPGQPFARVRVEEYTGDTESFDHVDGYHLVDVTDGHVWLEVGTDRTDDYYPSFEFSYTPKEGA